LYCNDNKIKVNLLSIKVCMKFT